MNSTAARRIYPLERDLHNWLYTPSGEPRGYIQPHSLEELWFHTGTACNLACPFCLEGSKPGDNRLQRMTLADVKPYIDAAVQLNVQQFSFTGGEPFIVKSMVSILQYALQHKPCLVLTNGTLPVLRRMHQIQTLSEQPHTVAFRISIDYPDADRHNAGRGPGTFEQAWQGMRQLHQLGFKVSLARQMDNGEDTAAVDAEFKKLFEQYELPLDTTIVAFPDFAVPGSILEVPHITKQCMVQYHSEDSRRQFMCANSKMIVKKDGQMRVYSCTLVDDDDDYDQGSDLAESLVEKVMLKHHRCYSCFAYGASCSER